MDSSKARDKDVDVVCVDGSEGADRAIEFALSETPPERRLVLLFGAQVPLRESLAASSFMREGHYWDRNLPDVYAKYTERCQKAGRRCDFVHFHFHGMSQFGQHVCSVARKRHAHSVIMGRRRKEERTITGRFLGSGSQTVVNSCSDLPVTLVTAESIMEGQQ